MQKMAEERQSDLSVVYGVCPQKKAQLWTKDFVLFKQAGAQSENDIKIRLLLVCHLYHNHK